MEQYSMMEHPVYEFYESRGKAEGLDFADWLEAVRIISEPGSGDEE